MLNKLRTIQAFILLILCMMAAGTYAAEETISGIVQEVSRQAGLFTLSAEDGGLLELRAPVTFLANLRSGDAVQVRMSGTRVIDITKQEALQPPNLDGQRQSQPPPGTKR